ncbi:MAG: hypothetical protein KF708_01125 [Pirellulales bacterium]|nr:hypothetical protein [Pirellulales bacterium]
MLVASGLTEVVLETPSDDAWPSKADDQHARVRVAALRVSTLDQATIREACTLASMWDAETLIVRPTVEAQSAASEPSTWRVLAAAVEPFGQSIALDLSACPEFDARAMAKLAKYVNDEHVRLCFDLGAYAGAHPFSHWEVALQRVVPYVGVLWLAEFSGTPGDDARPPLGEGTIDYLRAAEIVRPMRMDPLAVIDVAPPRRRRGSPAEACAAALEQSVLHLQRCGWFDP